MSKNIVILIDTLSTFTFHEKFNSAFLFSLQKNNPSSIKYIADSTSIEQIKNISLDNRELKEIIDKVDFKNITLIKGDKFYHIFLRFLFGAILNLYYLLKYRKFTVVFAQLNPFSATPIKWVMKYLKTRLFIICHGELSFVELNCNCFQPVFWYKLFMKRFFYSKLPENLTLIVLGNSIFQNIQISFPKIVDNCLVINHPYIFQNNNSLQFEKKSHVLKFGWVGTAIEPKGFKYFIELSKFFTQKRYTNFSATVVGRHSCNPTEFPFIDFIATPFTFLSRSEFEKAMCDLNFVLFFYTNDQYRLTASGAIFDAIEHNKIIIALKNDYFEDVFQQCGSLGYLCNSIEEMYHLIEYLLNNSVDYSELFKNLEYAREKYDARNQFIKIF